VARDSDRTGSARRFVSDDRSLSDTIGFVLTFGIIITSVGFVSTVGIGELEEFQTTQQLENADRTFELIARSFDEIEESQTSVRTDAIDLNDGSIRVARTSSVDVWVNNTDTGDTYHETVPLNALVYDFQDTSIAYENGATFRTQRDGGIRKHDPNLICTEDVAVISLVTVTSPTARQIGGEGTLRITGRRTNTSLLYPLAAKGSGNASTANHVDLKINSDRAREWRLHFEGSDGNWNVESSSDSELSVHCGTSNDLDRVYVRRTVVEVTFSG
jgi:hypothetical protein